MAVCYFDADYSKKYDCSYELENNAVNVSVRYNIINEIEPINGVRMIGANTEYRIRDILIVDYERRRSLVLKNAFYAGHNSIYGTPDGRDQTTFRANVFFVHSDYEKLSALPETPKVSKIRIFSKVVIDWIGHPSVLVTKGKEKRTIELLKNQGRTTVNLNHNNIKSLSLSDNWTTQSSSKQIVIDLDGYIELELCRRVNYEEVSEYVTELITYLQLYCPDRMKIDKIEVMVEQTYFGFHFPLVEIAHKDKLMPSVVNAQLLDFLKECYTKIPYRKSKEQIRNIPYIVLRTSRSLEDKFLLFYRFIECYYKKTRPGTAKTFITCCIKEHHPDKDNLSEEQIEDLAHEIISLRNHYVHSGYYIKNSSLKIRFDKINGRKNPKDYTANNVDVDWIYERTKILHKIVISIIYTCMLGYQEYNYRKHF